jgi:DNA-binding SARP family transcriptional activator
MQTRDAATKVPTDRSDALNVDGDDQIGLELMSGFALVHRRRPVTLPLTVQRVIAFVALRERPTLRLHVAGTLWMDLPERRALANLRSALWRLRQPGIDIVVASGLYLSLRPDVRVDVRELTTQSRAMLGRDARPETAAFGHVLAAGDLLPDWYDDWVLVERERLRQLRLHALEKASADLAAESRFGEAIEAALAAIADEPLRESAHRQLISVYLAEGNRIEAVRQFDQYARLVREELGLAPAAEIRGLLGTTLPRVHRHLNALASRRRVDRSPVSASTATTAH